MNRVFSLLFVVALLACGCQNVSEEVALSYADGSRRKVVQSRQEGDRRVRTGEQLFYPNGKVQMEKHFAGKEEAPTGVWHYYYIDGQPFATGTFDKDCPLGRDWHFYSPQGGDLFKEVYDSLKVVELSELQSPATVVLVKGNVATQYQFYSDGSLRSKGQFHNGRRHGHWAFYHANGLVQTEADFVDGKANGPYCVYRENGIPYYRGLYSDGRRTGRWEFYDADGILTSTQQF